MENYAELNAEKVLNEKKEKKFETQEPKMIFMLKLNLRG